MRGRWEDRGVREQPMRHHGKHRGSVVGVDDPLVLGRVQVRVPAVLGETLVWALPCVPIGGPTDPAELVLPAVGADVWVEFEQGDPEHPVWVGTFWPG